MKPISSSVEPKRHASPVTRCSTRPRSVCMFDGRRTSSCTTNALSGESRGAEGSEGGTRPARRGVTSLRAILGMAHPCRGEAATDKARSVELGWKSTRGRRCRGAPSSGRLCDHSQASWPHSHDSAEPSASAFEQCSEQYSFAGATSHEHSPWAQNFASAMTILLRVRRASSPLRVQSDPCTQSQQARCQRLWARRL